MDIIYVNTEAGRDALLAQGATLMGAHEETSLWAFRADDIEKINFGAVGDYVLSNVLMF